MSNDLKKTKKTEASGLRGGILDRSVVAEDILDLLVVAEDAGVEGRGPRV